MQHISVISSKVNSNNGVDAISHKMLPVNSLILFTFTISATIPYKLNPEGPTYRTYSSDCILEIAKSQFLPTNTFLTILSTPNMTSRAHGIQNKVIQSINQLSLWSLEIVKGERIQFESGEICLNCINGTHTEKKLLKNIFQPKVKAQFCLMIIDSQKHFLERLDDYLNAASYNFRAYFLVYFSETTSNYERTATDILISLWDRKIFNSAVIIAKNSLKHFNIYGMDVYASADVCGGSPKLLLLNTCTEGIIDKDVWLFGNKLPKTFHDCGIDVVAMKYPPFVINSTRGFEIHLLSELGKILHITFMLDVEAEAVEWGVRLSNNNWTGPLQKVLESSAIAIGNIMADPDLARDFDLSIGYFYEHLVWVVPAALPIPRWKNIFVIFTYQLWLACIAYFILTAFLFQIGARFDNELSRFKNLGANFLASLRVLAGIASPRIPKTMFVRAAFICLAAYSMLLIVLYQTLLMTYLTKPIYESQISTVQQVLQSSNGIGGLKSFKQFFNVSTDKTAMKIYEIFEIYDPVNDTAYNWLLTVADDRDTCTVSSNFYVRYLLAKKDHAVSHHDTPKVFILNDVVFTYPIRMVMPKGFPLRDTFDRIIGYLINGGIIQKWIQEYSQRMKDGDESNDDDDDHDDTQQLTIDHLQGAFTLLLFGYLFGFSALISELLTNYAIKSGKVDWTKKWLTKKCAKCTRKKQI